MLIAFGIGAAVIGLDARDQVRSELAREQIVGTPDSTIPNQLVNTGREAQAFAAVIRKHTLEATSGKTYAQMPRFLDAAGKGTNDEKAAAKDPNSGGPLANPARNIWVTSTALSTALNTAYFAESTATFVTVIGIALLLTGIGFLVLTLRCSASPARRSRPPSGSPPGDEGRRRRRLEERGPTAQRIYERPSPRARRGAEAIHIPSQGKGAKSPTSSSRPMLPTADGAAVIHAATDALEVQKVASRELEEPVRRPAVARSSTGCPPTPPTTHPLA